ncbi:MAG: F0F1 ATP synthase subunit alpha, partial [Patescibacteria group bacterium]
IYLEQDLFNQGVRPAINAGLSVSRVGSNAQTKAMKKVAGKLRLALAQFRELASFVQFASDVDEATKKRIGHGRAITEILKQPDLSPLPFEKQVALFYATLNHYFDDIPAEKVTVAGNAFLDYLEKMQRDSVLEPIKKTKALDDAVEVRLKEAIEKFMALYR